MFGDLSPQEVIGFINFDALPLAALIIVLGVLLASAITRTFDNLGERFSDKRLQFKKFGVLLRFGIYLLVTVGAGSTLLELSSEAILAISGTFGLALGFALKDTAASLMSGVTLLMDQPFQVGDRISFDGYYGEVTKIGLRSVRLVTLDDNLVTIPNSRFQSNSVASANAGALDCMVVVSIYLSAGEDFVRARRLIAEATATSRYVYLDKPLVTLVSDEFLGERFVTIRSGRPLREGVRLRRDDPGEARPARRGHPDAGLHPEAPRPASARLGAGRGPHRLSRRWAPSS